MLPSSRQPCVTQGSRLIASARTAVASRGSVVTSACPASASAKNADMASASPFGGTSEEFRPALTLFTVAVTLEVFEQAPTARNPQAAAPQRSALLGEFLQDLHT